MKSLSLLIWLTQLALSVVFPLGGCIWLGFWLTSSCGWGQWAMIICVILGLLFALDGMRSSLKLMNRIAKGDIKEKPGISFNEHE